MKHGRHMHYFQNNGLFFSIIFLLFLKNLSGEGKSRLGAPLEESQQSKRLQ